MRELHELRKAPEPIMVRRVIHSVTEEQLAYAVKLRHHMERTKDVARWGGLNRQFHATLTGGDDSGRLANILSGLARSATGQRWLPLA